MEIQEIPKADWLDLLFDGRNKEYGAYDLRKNYNRRLKKAIALMICICMALAGSYAIAARANGTHVIKPIASDVIVLAEAHPDKPVETQPAPVVPKPHIATPQLATLRDVTTRITKDADVRPEDVPPANADVDNVKIGTNTNLTGSVDDGIAPPTNTGAGTGLLTAPASHDDGDDKAIFIPVENQSSYPGGPLAWKRFLLKNFHTPEEAINKEVSGTVVVQFVVDKEGNVSEVHAIDGPELLRAEAERVIKKSGKWEPGIQNGRKVASYKRQPITVELQDQ